MTTRRSVLNSFLAGLAGSAAHLTLMSLKDATGLLPGFQPFAEVQRGLVMMTGATAPVWLVWLLSFFNGSLVLGFVFSRVFRYLPARSSLAKGITFGVFAWLLSGLAMFPALGRGLFAVGLGLGAAPAFLMLVMLIAYSTCMSLAWSTLESPGRV